MKPLALLAAAAVLASGCATQKKSAGTLSPDARMLMEYVAYTRAASASRPMIQVKAAPGREAVVYMKGETIAVSAPGQHVQTPAPPAPPPPNQLLSAVQAAAPWAFGAYMADKAFGASSSGTAWTPEQAIEWQKLQNAGQ